MASLLPTPEPADPVEGALGHFEHTNWVKQSLKNLDAGTLRNNGDTSTGDLTVNREDTQDAGVALVGDGQRTIKGFSASGGLRWRLMLGDNSAETGGNVGSMFSLYAYADDGLTVRHAVLAADRNTGLLTVAGEPTLPRGIATKQYVDNGLPIGAIIAYGGSSLPAAMVPYWHICNGTAHGSAALKAILGGNAAADLTPNLTGQFIIGAGTGYNPKATGGEARVTLTAAESGQKGHSHTAQSAGVSVDHRHLVNPPLTGTTGQTVGHGHTISPTVYGPYNGVNQDGDITYRTSPTRHLSLRPQTTSGPDASHAHTVDIPAFWSEGMDVNHSHVVSVSSVSDANASQSHQNLPPYYALIYIIKKA